MDEQSANAIGGSAVVAACLGERFGCVGGRDKFPGRGGDIEGPDGAGFGEGRHVRAAAAAEEVEGGVQGGGGGADAGGGRGRMRGGLEGRGIIFGVG